MQSKTSIVDKKAQETRERILSSNYEKINNAQRSKRWVWTDFASKITGLAKIEDIQSMSDNQELIRFEQIRAENEIVKIESEENKLLNELQSSNSKLEDLFLSEKEVSETLVKLMDSETSILDKLEHLTDALESVSDLSIEYSDILNSLLVLDSAITKTENGISNIMTQQVTLSLIGSDILSKESAESLKLAIPSAVRIGKSSYIKIDFPKVDEWELFRFRSLPFCSNSSDNLFFKIFSEKQLIAKNKLGYLTYFDTNYCTMDKDLKVCDGSNMIIKRVPTTCIENLLYRSGSEDIPVNCKQNIKFVIEPMQSFMRKENFVVIFSPFNDIIEYRHDNGSMYLVGNLSTGLNKVFPRGDMYTSQLVIRQAGKVNNYTFATDRVLTEISSEFLDLTNNLTFITRMNDSTMMNNLKMFVKSEGSLGVDIMKAETQLRHIETIHLMANFSPEHFSLHKFSGVTSAVSWLSVLIALLIIAVPVLICCGTCKCCRTCGLNLFKGIGYMLLGILDLIRFITCHLFRSRPVTAGDVDRCASGAVGTKGEETTEYNELSETIHIPTFVQPNWSIVTVSDEKLIIHGNLEGEELYYNPLTKVVTDGTDTVRNLPHPDKDLLHQFDRKLKDMRVPEMLTVGKHRKLVKFPEVRFDPVSGNYVKGVADDIVSGFRKPLY